MSKLPPGLDPELHRKFMLKLEARLLAADDFDWTDVLDLMLWAYERGKAGNP